jgi:hypothetical protein
MKKFGFLQFSAAFLLILVFAGCKNNETTDLWFGENQPTLYVGDSERLKVEIEPETLGNESLKWFTDNPSVATVSGAGAVTAVGLGRAVITAATQDGQRSASLTLTVYPSVYVAGYEKNSNGKQVATLWKNGEALRLSDGDSDATASSVFINGNDVYVAGSVGDKNKRAVLWKNGALLREFGNETSTMSASSVFASGSDVYMVGIGYSSGEESVTSAMLWKNDDTEDLGYGESASANSVFVSGKDVYIAGYQMSFGEKVATLWKNKVSQRLALGASADSVYVSGADVYVSGYKQGEDGKFYATVWKNGQAEAVGTGKSKPAFTSIFAVGATVYVAATDAASGTTEFWSFTPKIELKRSVKNLLLGSISVVKNSFGALDIYSAGSEVNAGKWYAVTGEPVFPADRSKTQRLTDGSFEAKASAIFVR